ncbi:MAG: BrnT family toxin [Lachnospiraceae bacterium]|nr:BrnT family toxin [Lachnospiraceae bacterium]
MQFEWDSEKEKINIKKHGIDFETAKLVFADENRIEIFDYQHSTQCEDRYDTIGLVHEVLFVVYTERQERIRIISARLATAREREVYYDRRIQFD